MKSNSVFWELLAELTNSFVLFLFHPLKITTQRFETCFYSFD